MFLNPRRLVLALALLAPVRALAGQQSDGQAYCSYVMEQAQAQRDLLRTPAAVAGLTQPETGLPLQVVAAATLGLSEVKKAGLTMDAARQNCELYKSATETEQAIQYAVPSLERDALRNRLTLIDQATKSLDTLMDTTAKMVEAQNATRVMLFSLQTTRIKLDADRADTQSKISAIYTPQLSDRPLQELVTEKESHETGEQKALDRLSRQNSWDVALSVGVHQQINPVAQGAQPYGAVSLTYNFASRAINKHLDRAASAHEEWKKTQESDVVRSMQALRQQLADCVAAQQSRLQALQEQSGQIAKNLQLVASPDTSTAFDFRNQLTVAQMLLDIEAGDATFRIGRLQEFLAKNYRAN